MKPALTPWLRPAQGFFDLGIFEAAWANLDDLEPSAKGHPETLMFRLEILFAQNKWDDAASLGAGYCRDWPTYGDFFFKTANALIILTDYEKALVLLRSAPESLRREAEYHFWVASCACRSGRLEEAKAALSECHWDLTIQQLVLMDAAFEPLWQAYGPLSQWGLTSTDPRIDLKTSAIGVRATRLGQVDFPSRTVVPDANSDQSVMQTSIRCSNAYGCR